MKFIKTRLLAAMMLACVSLAALGTDLIGIQQAQTTRSPSDQIFVRWVDQGDGTWAMKMSCAGCSGGGGGGAAGYGISDVIVQDSIFAQGIRLQQVDPTGVISFNYVHFDGTAWTPTGAVAAINSLPQGAATSAKQPALGTAGAAATDVLTVQGIASMTALKVDPSAVTSPVSLATLPALVAGSAKVGQVAIDQTTPGTTNKVSIGTDGTVVANAATADGADVAQGAVADAAATAGATGSISAKLRALSRDLVANVGIASMPAVTVSSTVLPTGASTAAKQPALGTPGSPSGDVLTVQGATSMTALKTDPSGVTSPVSAASLPLPTGASTSANQSTEITSINQLHTDLTAALPAGTNLIGKVGIDQTTPGTTNAVQFPSGALGQVASASSLSTVRATDPDYRPASGTITIQDTGSSTATGQGGLNTVITGSPTAGSTQAFALNGRSTVRMQISGTWTGTLQSEVSMDGGTTYNPTPMAVLAGTPKYTSTFTLIGGAMVAVPGATHFRMRATAAVTGTATIQITATDAPGAEVTTSSVGLTAGANLIGITGIDQTTPGTTNAIDLKTIGGVTAPTLNTGASNAGTLRVAIAAVAQGASISERPIVVGAAGMTANPTAVANLQSAVLMADKLGRLVVVNNHVRDLVASADLTLTSTTTPTTLIAAGGASVFTDITNLVIGNSSATATLVTLSDGTASHIYSLPPTSTIVIPYATPLKATTANTAWTLACGTSVASVYAVVQYVKDL